MKARTASGTPFAVQAGMRIGVVMMGLGTLLGAESAWADDADVAQQRPVQITIYGAEPSVTLRVADAKTNGTVVTCQGACSFNSLPAKYQVYSVDNRTGEKHDFGMDAREARQFRFHAGNPAAKKKGLELGITGTSLLVGGVVLMVPWLFQRWCSNPDDDGGQPPQDCGSTAVTGKLALLGFGLGGVGGVLTGVGWAMFGHNRSRLVDVRKDAAAAASIFQWQVGLGALGPGAYGLAGSGRF